MDTIHLHLTLLFMLTGVFPQVTVRQIRYLNNIEEKEHPVVKEITKSIKGVKGFHSAEATLTEIELHLLNA